MFHPISKHLGFRQKYFAERRIFNSFLGVWKSVEILSLMFDILYECIIDSMLPFVFLFTASSKVLRLPRIVQNKNITAATHFLLSRAKPVPQAELVAMLERQVQKTITKPFRTNKFLGRKIIFSVRIITLSEHFRFCIICQ